MRDAIESGWGWRSRFCFALLAACAACATAQSTGEVIRDRCSSHDSQHASSGFPAAISHALPSLVQLIVLRDREGYPGDQDEGTPVITPAQSRTKDGEFMERTVSSGFFIGRGEVLTTAHAVARAVAIRVHAASGEDFTPTVVGIDPGSDVALLHVKGAETRFSPLVASLDATCPGDWLAALGAPFGFGQSATMGVVSSFPRDVPIASDYPMIQTDAAVNPGVSGGPLIDDRGRAVGMSTMIFSDLGGSVGISFALPMRVALRVADSLRAGGLPWRSAIGVHTQALTPQLARAFGMAAAQLAGTLISEVLPGSAAESAGLQPGDVVVALDGTPLQVDMEDVAPAVGARELRLTALRGGRSIEFVVALANAITNARSLASANAVPERLGLSLSPARTAGGIRRGVLVEGSTGPALMSGILTGDRICGIGNEQVESRDDFDQALAHPRSGPVPLLVCRGSRAAFVAVIQQ